MESVLAKKTSLLQAAISSKAALIWLPGWHSLIAQSIARICACT
jgi:hypothetical protein